MFCKMGCRIDFHKKNDLPCPIPAKPMTYYSPLAHLQHELVMYQRPKEEYEPDWE